MSIIILKNPIIIENGNFEISLLAFIIIKSYWYLIKKSDKKQLENKEYLSMIFIILDTV